MPDILTLLLTDAIKALPSAPVVEYSVWIPAVQSLPGLAQGAWGPWLPLARPYTLSKPTGETQRVTSGGNEYILALSVYCGVGLPVEMVTPGGRTCRVRYDGDQFVYRVMEVRTWGAVSDHAEIHCKRTLGEAGPQA